MSATIERPSVNVISPRSAYRNGGAALNPVSIRYTASDWAAFEEPEDRKHELREGVFIEMAGGTYEHNRIAANLLVELGNAVSDDCEVLGSDQKVYVDNRNGLYPDIVVVCGPPEIGVSSALYNPELIVEVLSPSTAGDDRGEKFEKYRTCPTLRHYILVEQHRPSVECFERGENGIWFLANEYHAIDETLTLTVSGVAISIPLVTIYRRVRFGIDTDESASNSDTPE